MPTIDIIGGMRVYLGADHAGFETKNLIKEHLTSQGTMLLTVAHTSMTLRMTTQHFVLKPHCVPSTTQVPWVSCSVVPATVSRLPRTRSRVHAVRWHGRRRPHALHVSTT